MRGRVLCAAGVLWMAGCTQDPLAERSIYWGLSPFERPTGPLVQVLDTDTAVPDKQGLLYSAMRDAQVAASYSDRALARLDEPGETASALADVIYAIEPAEAPAWNARDGAFGPHWGSHGFGLQRALNGMAAELTAASEEGSASAALREHGQSALRCTENTQARAGQLLARSQQALGAAAVPTLEQIREQAIELNRGVPSPGEGGCGLRTSSASWIRWYTQAPLVEPGASRRLRVPRRRSPWRAISASKRGAEGRRAVARLEVAGRADVAQPPLVEHRNPVAQVLVIARDRGAEEDGPAARPIGRELPLHQAPRRGIEAAHRLVEHQERQVGQQRREQAELLRHALGVASDRPVERGRIELDLLGQDARSGRAWPAGHGTRASCGRNHGPGGRPAAGSAPEDRPARDCAGA